MKHTNRGTTGSVKWKRWRSEVRRLTGMDFGPFSFETGNVETKSIEADKRHISYHPTLLAMFPLVWATTSSSVTKARLSATIENVAR